MKKSSLALLGLLFFVSGCVLSMDDAITDIVKASPMVKDFLEEYPNAQINVRYLPGSIVESEPDFIGNCSGVPGGNYYKVTISDPSGITIKAWVDPENSQIMCIFKESPVAITTTIKNGKIEDKGGEENDCEEHYERKCHEGHVYWYNSCGDKEEKKEYCENGCEAGECITISLSCTDSDGGKNYDEYGIISWNDGTIHGSCADSCSGNTLTECYCNENSQMETVEYTCPLENSCSDGRCLQITTAPPTIIATLENAEENEATTYVTVRAGSSMISVYDINIYIADILQNCTWTGNITQIPSQELGTCELAGVNCTSGTAVRVASPDKISEGACV